MAEKTQQVEQPALTLRAVIIGAVGSAVLTASSLFIALRMGMLPWPIAFAAIVSVLALRALGSKNLHEANVCHAAMSAGSMIAGGLAFTIPGLWIMGVGQDLTILEVLGASLAGTALGLIACSAMQPYFIREQRLAYPIGKSASDTLRAVGDSDAADAPALFGGMGFAALYAFLRDQLGLLPGVLFLNAEAIPGVVLGLYNSPMMLAMGFTVGVVPAVVWFIGAVLGHFGIVWALPALGIVDLATAGDIRVSIGLGLMLGCGAGTIVASFMTAHKNAKLRAEQGGASEDDSSHRLSIPRGIIAFVTAAAALLMTIALGLNPAASIIVTVGAWFCPYLSAWLTGTTGINPMEIFGMLVLLLVRFLFVGTSTKVLFLVAAVIAVACGIGGDLMNDFKAGDQLGTNPRDQYIGEVVGGIVGAVVAALLLMGMHRVYGSDAFGPNGQFVATQATNVAAMAGGIAHVPAFIVGIIAGCVLAILGLPVITLGIGVYLPFVMSSGAAIGAAVRIIFDRLHKDDAPEVVAARAARASTVASGLLGGESLVGVLIALVALASMVIAG